MFDFDPDMIFRIPALLITLTIHEYSHARAAVMLGDPTPRLMGRLTLNPIAHLDPIGLIMMWLFKFGWAKPVPFNPDYFQNRRTGTMWVALAGPASNIILAIIVAVIIAVGGKSFMQTPIGKILWWTYLYNVVFAIFNMLPIPPLDGSKVLANFLPLRMSMAMDRIEPYGFWIIMALVWMGAIGVILGPLIRYTTAFIGVILNIIF